MIRLKDKSCKCNGNKRTHIAIILDESGSMHPQRDSAISSVNEWLQTFRKNSKLGGKTFLSLVKFSDNVKSMFESQRIENIEGEICHNDYSPNGSTALFDTIGYTCEFLEKLDQTGDVGFLVLIVSDGEENASKLWKSEAISAKVKGLEGTGKFTFQYVGCDEGALKQASSLGFNNYKFEDTDEGWKDLSRGLVANTCCYMNTRSAGGTQVANFMEQDKKDVLIQVDEKDLTSS